MSPPAKRRPASPAGSKRAAGAAGSKRAAARASDKPPDSPDSPQGPQAGARIGLHSLRPAPGSRRPRKRLGRGEGSGTGKTAGRGHKGAGARSGARKRASFEGGQNPIHMRMRKLRGPHMKKSMPFEPFRTHSQPVNLDDLEKRFESGAAVTLEALREHGLGQRRGVPVKVLARGELGKPLTVHAHAFSARARERIEAAGGTCVVEEP
ncbi:MAG TPA: 50S ribosomal protein L15 [Solirubrobacteraceae bacterium]|jgi:large subunit ribosomal protein L15|nr:50S ribosomal protein L15 [Solirubrobacteraceae bacterium]